MRDLDFLLQAIELKDVPRKGWILRGVREPEDVGSHSWGVALLTMMYSRETGLNESKVLKMAVIHDLAEAQTGDRAMGEVYQEITNEQRIDEEQVAWENYERMADVSDFRELWEELESKSSPEAKFVADMDLLDMCLTALKYERQDRYDPSNGREEHDNLDGFFETADNNIQTDIGRDLYSDILNQYLEEKGDSQGTY